MRAASSRPRSSSRPTGGTSRAALSGPTRSSTAAIRPSPIPKRRRLILTRKAAGLAPDPGNPRARLWNPAEAPFETACAALGLNSGTIAIIGGPQAYILFLKLGYDCFHLSRAVKVRLPGGLPLFGGDPDGALRAAGLKPGPTQWLEDGLTLTDWERPE